MKRLRTLAHDVALFLLVAVVIGAPAAMAPQDEARLEALHREALAIQESLKEFRRRIDAKWLGYEQVGLVSSPIAVAGDHDRLEHP